AVGRPHHWVVRPGMASCETCPHAPSAAQLVRLTTLSRGYVSTGCTGGGFHLRDQLVAQECLIAGAQRKMRLPVCLNMPTMFRRDSREKRTVTKEVTPIQEEPSSRLQKLACAGNILGEAFVARVPYGTFQRRCRATPESRTNPHARATPARPRYYDRTSRDRRRAPALATGTLHW